MEQQLQKMDFKVRKHLLNAREQQNNERIEQELDTLQKIEDRFNNYCSVYEKQFDQILISQQSINSKSLKRQINPHNYPSKKNSSLSTSNSQHKLEIYPNTASYKKQQSLLKQSSITQINASVINDKNNNFDSIDNRLIKSSQQSQRSCLKSRQTFSMTSLQSPNFLIRKHHPNHEINQNNNNNNNHNINNNNDQKKKQTQSISSFSHLDELDSRNDITKNKIIVKRVDDKGIEINQQKNNNNNYQIQQQSISTNNTSFLQNLTTRNTSKATLFDGSSQPYMGQNLKQQQQQLSRSQIRNDKIYSQQANQSTSPIKKAFRLSPSKNDHQKSVKFAKTDTNSPQIRSLIGFEDIQDNLVKIGIGSLMLEQLRLSQQDLNKVEDINSFSDRESLLSSKILREFGIGQSQVSGFKKEEEKQEFIKKTIDSTVSNLYKKWVKSYEERIEKIDSMEEEYEEFKEKINKREKQDFEWINVETSYKALENELKQLIVKKLNDYQTQTFILENVMKEKKKSQQYQQNKETRISSMVSLNQQIKSQSEIIGNISNHTDTPPQSPLNSNNNNNNIFSSPRKQNERNSYSIKIINQGQNNNNINNSQQMNQFTPRKHSVDSQNKLSSQYSSQVKQMFSQQQSTSSRAIQDRNSHVGSTYLQTDHSNITDVNTSITKQSNKKLSLQQQQFISQQQISQFQSQQQLQQQQPMASFVTQFLNNSSRKQSQVAQPNSSQPEMSLLSSGLIDSEGRLQQPENMNEKKRRYVYGENTYEKEEIIDEGLMNKIHEQVDKSEQIKELGDKLSEQIDWKIELDSAFVELRKSNRKRNNKISKGNNMNLITFFPIMQDVFFSLKSDRNKEKLMQKYAQGQMLTNEQFSFLASTNSLLNRFIDRDYLEKGIHFFQKKGIQSQLEYLLAENIIKTYELIKQIIYEQRRNYLHIKNDRLLKEQDMFKERQEQKIIQLQQAKQKLILNNRMNAVCKSLDTKYIKSQQNNLLQAELAANPQNNKNKKNDPISNIAQKFVNNIKTSLMEKQSLRDIFITNISKPKQVVKIEEIKQKKKNDQEKQEMLDKISFTEGKDLLSRLTNKAVLEDDPKNIIRQTYHPSSKIFILENGKDENKQLTNEQKKIIQNEVRRFKRKVNSTKNDDQEEAEQQIFSKFYTGGPLQSSYINSKYYGQKQIETIIRVQAVARGYLARKILKRLKEKSKRDKEIRKREEKNREKMLLKERIKLELYSSPKNRSIIDKLTPKSKKNANPDGSPKIGFSDTIQSKKISKNKLSKFSKPIHRKSILTQSHFDQAMKNEMKLNYHRKVILNQDVSNRFQKLIGAAKNNNFGYIEKGKFQFFTMDVNKIDEEKNSALFYAAGHGNILFCQYLIELGADVNQVCSNGDTPFHMACQSNNKHLIMLFQQAGANLDKINNEGFTPLSFASFDILNQLDAIKIISLRNHDDNQQIKNKNIKVFKRGMPQSEFQTSAIEYNPEHLFTQFPSKNNFPSQIQSQQQEQQQQQGLK